MEHIPDPDLIDKVWAWERRDPSGNPIEEIIVSDPENYLLSFAAGGTFVTKMNCRNAFGGYASSSPAETVNNIFMVAGPTTMIFCGEDSLDVQMSQMFGPAQRYQFEEDGAVLKFSWVAGGPIDYYRYRNDLEPPPAQ